MKVREKMLIRKSDNKTRVRICTHCGGRLRFYRGTLTCLMCGRDVDHICKDCQGSNGLVVEIAQAGF